MSKKNGAEMKLILNHQNLKSEYADLFQKMDLTKIVLIELGEIVREIKAHQPRYEFVQNSMMIPWELVAAIHHKEASGRFSRNIHNGQLWSKPTTAVPKGRGPFESWEEAAIDAIKLKEKTINLLGIKSLQDWTLTKCLYFAERYNGMGYRNHGINSPYLWSCAGKHIYEKGGYKFDGKYDPEFVVKNIGIAPILSQLGYGISKAS